MLTNIGWRRKFAGGETIQHRGDAGNGFWLVENGKVMACRSGRDGDLVVYGVLGPGDLFGEVACFCDVPRQVDAVADGDAELIWVDATQIDQMLRNEPDFARWLLASLANQLRTALDRIESQHSLPARARIARVLSDMATREGPAINLTQQELADFVGVSRVTAGQVLAKFAADGLIALGYRRIEVCDQATLAKHCQVDD